MYQDNKDEKDHAHKELANLVGIKTYKDIITRKSGK